MVSWKKKKKKKKRKTSGGGEWESPPTGITWGAEEEKVGQIPPGHVPMLLAGGDDDKGGDDHHGGERVLVPVQLLSDPSVAELLDMAVQRYGYGQPGVLRVPYDAGHFRQVLDGAMHRCGGVSSSA